MSKLSSASALRSLNFLATMHAWEATSGHGRFTCTNSRNSSRNVGYVTSIRLLVPQIADLGNYGVLLVRR